MEDLPPCAYGYLKNIEKDIRQKKLPYVMSIEGGFGSGKTHFVTRLCQYLRDYDINAIYLNAFECDNIDNPTLAILDAISKNNEKDNNKFEKFKELWRTFNGSTTVNVNFGIGCSIELSKLCLKDKMREIKGELQKDIKKNGRLVLIVDELDRCDPRFCVNLLETTKHFFDLDGLFIILSFSDKAVLAALSNTYGSDFIKDNSENYLTKFIEHRTKIYEVEGSSYSSIVSKILQDNGCKVSKEDLREICITFGKAKLSLREIKKCVERTTDLVKEIHDEKNLLLYSYIACRYDKDVEKVEEMKHVDDYGYKENRLFERRQSQFENFTHGIYKEIVREFHITKYVDPRFFYQNLRDDIRKCYQLICKDPGNAKKLAEIFLLDLFKKGSRPSKTYLAKKIRLI